MKHLHQRAHDALSAINRSEFVASSDLSAFISGHSIPQKEALRHLLTLMPEIRPDQTVLHIGGGSGYVAAVLARLARKVIYVDRNPTIAEAAQERFSRLGATNVSVIVGDAEQSLPIDNVCDYILCTTFLESNQSLLTYLSDTGFVVCLEGRAGPVPTVTLFSNTGGVLSRERTLGWIDFNRSSEQILIDLGVIDQKSLESARAQAERTGGRLLDTIRDELSIEETELYRTLAKQRRMDFLAADDLLQTMNPQLFRRFSRAFLDLSRLIPINEKDGKILVVTDDPDARTDQLERLTKDAGIECALVSATDFRRLWSSLDLTVKGQKFIDDHNEAVSNRAGEHEKGPDSVLGGENDRRHLSPYLVSMYEAILLDAVSEKASDVHIEIYGERVRLRIRVDGELHELTQYQLSPRELKGIVNVIKLRAELNIAEHRLPQGGRSLLKLGDTSYDLRVQTQPSLHGEHVVIRLLPQTGRAMTIAELGMSESIGSRYERLLDNPAGLVLVVGPTGSGKSTTLYAGLQNLADDGRRKVITVEDPIEYSIDNVQQTRARPDIGFGFSDAMHAFVREDPDVIMVGEIRDQKTALEAIRASQTGHVVLSTLHCNDAVDSLQRLYDLGIHPNSIAGELLAVIAQRLAKRICQHCREAVQPDQEILDELFPDGPPSNFRCYVGTGCVNCRGRGTRGRVAIVEYMEVNGDIRDAISSQPPVGELRWRALDAGLITMRDSALDHVISGIIPLTELPRILPMERMAPEIRGGRRSQA